MSFIAMVDDIKTGKRAAFRASHSAAVNQMDAVTLMHYLLL